jgi:hypothetical protein
MSMSKQMYMVLFACISNKINIFILAYKDFQLYTKKKCEVWESIDLKKNRTYALNIQ